MAWLKPETEQIRAALRQYAPQLTHEPIEFFAEGWAMWVFRAGDYVLRFPKRQHEAAELEADRRLLPELAMHLSTLVPVPVIYGENGPNGAPFTGHCYLPGVSLIAAVGPPSAARGGSPEIRLAPTLGREIGVFLRELHSFPAERAVELGMPLKDGPASRKDYTDFYEDVIRLIFPLISCEARTYTEMRFETFINDPANFDFEPRLIHHDLDRQNLLIDPETGSLAGVIDWGSAVVGNAAIDLWLPLIDFDQLGIGGQLQDFLDAYGPVDLERARTQVEFTHFLWPFHDMLYGQRIGEDDFVEGGIKALNASLPADLRCD